MRLFIAEKPSLARAIAAVLPSPHTKGQGYIKCGDHDVVTWCAGHILELASPEQYRPEYKTWTVEHLPIVPTEWRLSVTAPDLLKTIKGLLPHASQVIHAGDPDREGQLLIDEVLEYLAYRGPVLRILVNDLNPSAVRMALGKLQPNDAFRGLYDSARARQRADWLYGLNLTRLYTLLGRAGGHDGVLSVGRVQTPLLGLVVRRDLEIEGFTPKPYFVVTASARSSGGPFRATWRPPEGEFTFLDGDRRLISKTHADQIVERSSGRDATVSKCSREEKAEPAPLPYCLSELQVDAGRQHGLTPAQTLEACQALYEVHRLVTYPRSDCSYLPEGHFLQAPAILTAIARNNVELAALARSAQPTLKSRAWSDAKISAHHAIIPTDVIVRCEALGHTERAVYELVARRYLVQFYAPYRFHQTVIVLNVGGGTFAASGRQPADQGWRVVLPPPSDDDGSNGKSERSEDESKAELPLLQVGEKVRIDGVVVAERKTTAPKRFTDATLVQAMTGIARFVSDPKIKALLQESDGIGTPATQAAIIQTLYDRHFIEKRGRHTVSTAIGRALVATLPPVATTPDMTALWEAAMKKIGAGQMSLAAFIDGVLRQLLQLVENGRAKGPLVVPGAQPCTSPPCPGFLRRRTGSKGAFLACSRYPACSVTKALAPSEASRAAGRRSSGRLPGTH